MLSGPTIRLTDRNSFKQRIVSTAVLLSILDDGDDGSTVQVGGAMMEVTETVEQVAEKVQASLDAQAQRFHPQERAKIDWADAA